MQDLRHAWRLFVKSRGFTAVVVTVLALGIGATTAVYSIIYGALLRPLPYRDADRLVDILDSSQREKELAKIFASYADYLEFTRSSHTLESLAAETWAGRPTAVLTGLGPAKAYLTIPVTYPLFSTLGVQAQLGRAFKGSDLGGGCSIVLANNFWRDHLNADPRIIGQSLALNDRSCTVLGIMPAKFALYPPETQIWNLILPSDTQVNRYFGVFMIGRLKPGVSIAQANAELSAIHRALHTHDSDGESDFVPLISNLRDQFTWLAGRNLRTTLALLFAAVFLVLLIACLNVATLLLGRSFVRAREFAIRIALGSGRTQLFRQLLIESALLSLAGGGLGVLFAFGATQYFVHANPIELPVATSISINIPVLVFACLVSIGTALAFAIGPVWIISRGDVYSALRVSAANLAPARQTLSQCLVAAEMAFSVMLLAGAGLFIRSVLNFGSAPLGFATGDIVAANGSLPNDYDENPARRSVFFQRLQQELAGMSGIKNATIASTLPPYGLGLGTVEIEGRPISPHHQQHDVGDVAATSSYFELFKIPFLQGRSFTNRDMADAPHVALVNEAFAREYFPGRVAVGQRIRVGSEKEWVIIVGMVGDEKRPTVYEEMKWIVQPVVYRPVIQHPPAGFSVAAQSTAGLKTIARSLDNAVSLIESHAALGDAETMQARLAPYFKYPQFRAMLLTAFSFIAVLLAAVGLYGVLAQFVAHRTADIGIRRAIGATGSDLMRLIAWKGGMPAATGLLIGLTISFGLARYVRSLLYGITPADPITFGAVVVVFIAAAATAMAVPARRALRVEPITALRAE